MPSVIERLSVLTDEVSANFVEALDWAVRNGFKHVEVRMVDGANVSNLSDPSRTAPTWRVVCLYVVAGVTYVAESAPACRYALKLIHRSGDSSVYW